MELIINNIWKGYFQEMDPSVDGCILSVSDTGCPHLDPHVPRSHTHTQVYRFTGHQEMDPSVDGCIVSVSDNGCPHLVLHVPRSHTHTQVYRFTGHHQLGLSEYDGLIHKFFTDVKGVVENTVF